MITIGSKVKCVKDSDWITLSLPKDADEIELPIPVYNAEYIVTATDTLEETDYRLKQLNLHSKFIFQLEGMGEQWFTTRRFKEIIE